MPRARPASPLSNLVEESPQPVYALDDHRRIVACNRACAEWVGLEVEQLVGQRCDYAAREIAALPEQAAAALCPPPAAFQGEVSSCLVTWRREGGEWERRRGTFLPLKSEEPAGVLAVLGPVTTVAADARVEEPEDAAALHARLQQWTLRQRQRYRLDLVLGDSPAMRRVRAQIALLSNSSATALIVGPPGSGREHIARTIACADQPGAAGSIVPLDMEVLDPEQLDSALAAFTGSGASPATPGTLILVNADQSVPGAQTILARRLERENLGCRILATAVRPLTALAAAGEFDPDLAATLSTVVVEIPPLNQRRQDIPLLVQRLVEEHNAAGGRQLAGFSPAALDRLAALPWTGDVEELAEVVREACRTVTTVWIGEADLPPRVRAVLSAGMHPRRTADTIQLDDFLLEIENELIVRAMRQAKNNKAQAARLLGVSRARLLRRLEQLGLISRQDPEIEFHLEEDTESDAGEENEASSR